MALGGKGLLSVMASAFSWIIFTPGYLEDEGGGKAKHFSKSPLS